MRRSDAPRSSRRWRLAQFPPIAQFLSVAPRLPGVGRLPLLQLLAVLLSASAILASACERGPKDPRLSLSGTVEATEVTVSSRVAGQVLQRLVREGDRVKAGQLLVEIEHEDTDLQLRQTRAVVAQAEAQYELLRRGARREDLEQAMERVHQAEASREGARTDLRRVEELMRTAAAPQAQLDTARTRVEVMTAQAGVAHKGLARLRAGARIEELHMARAQVERAKAQTAMLEKRVADCRVLAPIAGRITAKYVEPGELVSLGTPLLRLSDLGRVYIMVYVPEAELPKIRLGQAAAIRVDAFGGRELAGTVTYLSSQAEFTPKNVQTREERTQLVFGVKVEADNPDELLKPGLPADVLLARAGPTR